MKTDGFWLSLAWGRVGAAILVIVGVALGAFGIDFSADEQSEVYGMIAGILTSIGGLLAIISKFREQARAKTPTDASAGKASMKAVFLLFMIGLCAIFMFSGCAGMQNATATQQIMAQTNDPMTVSLAVYHDGLKLYVDAQELYKPYQDIVEATDPEIDAKIIGYFQQARKVLKDWKKFGVIPGDEEKTFREALRDVSLTMAMYLQTTS